MKSKFFFYAEMKRSKILSILPIQNSRLHFQQNYNIESKFGLIMKVALVRLPYLTMDCTCQVGWNGNHGVTVVMI